MSIVTDIKKQRRAEGRYSVYVDGHYSFSLTDIQLSSAALLVGQELTAAEVAQYQVASAQAKAYIAAVRYLSVRPRSRREVVDYLRRKAFTDEDAAFAVERLEQIGMVDDQKFAAAWVADRQALRPRSRRVLAQELLAKGVGRSDVEATLAEVDDDAEVAAATALAAKKRKLPQYTDPRKLLDYLMRQGYSYDVARRISQESSSDSAGND